MTSDSDDAPLLEESDHFPSEADSSETNSSGYCCCQQGCLFITSIFKSSSFYIFVILATFIGTTYVLSQKQNHFDYYVYASQWPSALCEKINQTHHGNCSHVPEIVDTWVVHGLWPSRAHAGTNYGPLNCDDGWPFHNTTLFPILPTMNQFWPNLMQNKADDSFWQHEWDKHGTCACQHRLCTQRGYFEKALNVRAELDFDTKLSEANIFPNLTKTYALQDIIAALEPEAWTRGSNKYQCYATEKNATFQVIAQIEVCLSKDKLAPTACLQFESTDPIIQRSPTTIVAGYGMSAGFSISAKPDYAGGPYNPSTCNPDLPVKIYPIHMPIGARN